jgi:hypothetical protein
MLYLDIDQRRPGEPAADGLPEGGRTAGPEGSWAINRRRVYGEGRRERESDELIDAIGGVPAGKGGASVLRHWARAQATDPVGRGRPATGRVACRR